MRAKADLFRNPLDTYSALAAYYAGKASTPDASYTIRQAAICFWSLSLQFDGEIASHNALAAAGIALPDFLRNVPPSGELVKRQKRERAEKRDRLKAAA
jgi:hypothetical protein